MLTASQLKDILELLERLAKFSDVIRRHGGDFEEYLRERDPKTGALPTYLVKIREGNSEWVTYFPGEAEMRAFHEENRDLNLFEDDAPAEAGPEWQTEPADRPKRREPAAPQGKPGRTSRISCRAKAHLGNLRGRDCVVGSLSDSDRPIRG